MLDHKHKRKKKFIQWANNIFFFIFYFLKGLFCLSKGQGSYPAIYLCHTYNILRGFSVFLWPFDSLLKSQCMEKVSKTSDRLGANVDIMTTNNISGKSSTEKRCLCVADGFTRKEYPTGKRTSKHNKAFRKRY